MTKEEVTARLEGIERYNDYFRRELDAQGQPLTQHIVGPRELWNIMTREGALTLASLESPSRSPWSGQGSQSLWNRRPKVRTQDGNAHDQISEALR